jgi:Holliday junction resolvasome RuvABC endonuclease subunit
MGKRSRKMAEKIKVLGLDISLNHGAGIELTNGKISDFFYYTNKAGSAKQSWRATRIPSAIYKTKDNQRISVSRLSWLKEYLTYTISNLYPQYVGLEDYAVGAERGSHYLGEIGGITRLIIYESGFKLRLHDPTSVKMFAAHDGTCRKDAVARAVKDKWGCDFSSFDQPSPRPTKKNPEPTRNKQTSEDLCDAYAIAQMVWTEVKLRSGCILLSDLHEKEIRVFNRTTKTYPVNLLNREWISK